LHAIHSRSIGEKMRGWLLEIRRHLTISHDSPIETFRDFIKLISLRRPSKCGLRCGLPGIQFAGGWIYSNFPELKSRVATSTATKKLRLSRINRYQYRSFVEMFPGCRRDFGEIKDRRFAVWDERYERHLDSET